MREAAGDGGTVVYGDAGRREALQAAGLMKARALAITFADTAMALKILHHVGELKPELPVIVRTIDDADIDRLLKAGAAEVVPEVQEVCSPRTRCCGRVPRPLLANIRTIREERYASYASSRITTRRRRRKPAPRPATRCC